MSVGGNVLLLLDTNILVHWARQDRTGEYLRSHYALTDRIERPLFSTVSEGEILGLARCWNWGAGKKKALSELLGEFVRFESSQPEVVAAYSELFYEDRTQGRNTGENDLWIAACAKATGAVLVSCDADFLWLSPTHIRVQHIPEVK